MKAHYFRRSSRSTSRWTKETRPLPPVTDPLWKHGVEVVAEVVAYLDDENRTKR